MRARRVLGAIGRTMIGTGVVILLFVAYQLWGTGLAEARSQEALKDQFAAIRPPVQPSAAEIPPPAPEGEAIAIMKIPKIGLEKAVVEGVSLPELKKGPGHYPSTPLPGQKGNAGIAGHRTTYGAPFFRLDELAKGDEILVTTRQGRFRYAVTESIVVHPRQTEVLGDRGDNRITITTCHPRFSAAQRLVVTAVLQGEAAPSRPRTGPVVRPEEEESLSGDPTARGPAFFWGVLCLLAGSAIWLVARSLRRPWIAYLVAAPGFAVLLFVFFENVNRLLPANV